jgi:hypothetical protein
MPEIRVRSGKLHAHINLSVASAANRHYFAFDFFACVLFLKHQDLSMHYVHIQLD